MKSANESLTKFREYLGLDYNMAMKVGATIGVILFLWFVRRLVIRFVFQKTEDLSSQYHWRKTTKYVSVGIGTLITFRIWFDAFDSISTYLGLLSAGVAIALQDSLANFVGWLFIVTRHPFKVGDRIEIDGVRGDVIDQRIFMFSLMEIGNWVDADQSTGRVIHVPNGKVFKHSVGNYSAGFQYIWEEIDVLVTFESDWRKAKHILGEIATQVSDNRSKEARDKVRNAAKKFMIFYSNLTPKIYTTVKDSGVMLTMRILVEPRKRRNTNEVIWEEILDEFAKYDNIDLAYPTQRFIA